MMTARKRVGPQPTHRLAVRQLVDYSSSDHFTSDNSSRDPISDSSSKGSSDFHLVASPNSFSRHSSSDHSSPDSSCDLPITYAGPPRKRHRSPMTSVLALSPISGALSLVPVALSPARADLLPSPKRIRDYDSLSEEIDPVEADIEACFAFADIIRGRGIYVRVEVKIIAQDVVEARARDTVEVRDDRVIHPAMSDDVPESTQEERVVEGTYETLEALVQRFHDHIVAIPVHRVQVIESVQREQGHRIVGIRSAVTIMTERVAELERDNRRFRGTLSVEGHRVNRLPRSIV
ncbi:hypothetical protein Tco_0267435 [Tanacetum coccineum]